MHFQTFGGGGAAAAAPLEVGISMTQKYLPPMTGSNSKFQRYYVLPASHMLGGTICDRIINTVNPVQQI